MQGVTLKVVLIFLTGEENVFPTALDYYAKNHHAEISHL